MPHSLTQHSGTGTGGTGTGTRGRKAVKRSHYPHPGNYPFPLNLEIPRWDLTTLDMDMVLPEPVGLRLEASTPSLRHPPIRYASLLSWWTINRCSSVIAKDCRICGKSRTGRS
jgi:hypothetical protein